MAASQTTALQNCAPISSCHALAETMDAHTAADLRLIRTFRHSSFLTLKIIASYCVPSLRGGRFSQRSNLHRLTGDCFGKNALAMTKQSLRPAGYYTVRIPIRSIRELHHGKCYHEE